MTKKKIAIAIAAAALAGTCAIGGTLAWLTSTDQVSNTFTMGKITMDIKESPVNSEGTVDTEAPDVDTQPNAYKISPQATVLKDPNVTISADSEDCYVFVAIKNDLKGSVDGQEDPQKIATYTVTDAWEKVDSTITDVEVYLYTAPEDDIVMGGLTNVTVFPNLSISEDLVEGTLTGGVDVYGYAHQAENTNLEAAKAEALAHFAKVIK